MKRFVKMDEPLAMRLTISRTHTQETVRNQMKLKKQKMRHETQKPSRTNEWWWWWRWQTVSAVSEEDTQNTHTHSHCVMSVCFVVNLSQPQTHHLSFGAHTGIRHTLAHALTPITRFDLPVFAIKYRNKCIFGSCLAQFFLLSDFFFFFLLLCDCVDVNFRVYCACRLMTLADGRPFCVFLFSQCRLSYIYMNSDGGVHNRVAPKFLTAVIYGVWELCDRYARLWWWLPYNLTVARQVFIYIFCRHT